MKILVVEDNLLKRKFVEEFLSARKIDTIVSFSVNSAIKEIVERLNEFSGIILDLGLTSYDDSMDYDSKRGLDLVEELTRREIDIPILINSSTTINLPNIMENHSNVKGQTSIMEDGNTKIESFIKILKEKKQ